MSIIVYKDIINKMTAYKNDDEITLDWEDSYLKRHQTKISQDVLNQVLVGDRSGEELQFYAEVGTWPLPKAEQEEAERVFIRETPTALISDPTAIALFKKEELENLIPIAEKEWIDWKGKLPENYTRPILD